MRIRKRKKTWIYVVTALLLCAIVGGCVYAFVGTDNKDNMKKISPTFSLGGLDENGKYVETKESIYTKDAFECKGLTVTPEFESQVTYQIFFYDSTGEFISKTEKLEKVYKDEVAIEVTHARIVITPNEDEDGNAVTMNVFNKSKYAKQLTLKVYENQKTLPKTYTLDLTKVQLIDGMINGSTWKSSGSASVVCNSGVIDLSLYDYYDTITLENKNGYEMYIAFLTELPSEFETPVEFSLGHSLVITKESSVVLNIPSDAKYLMYRNDYSTVEAGYGPSNPSSIVFSKI